MTPARTAARASIQLSLPPILAESGPETGSTCAAFNDSAIKAAFAAAEAEPEESVQWPAKDQSWAEFHELNAKRQHSTSNLVAFRRNLRQLSVELFEESDSDDSSTSTRSSGAIDEEGESVGERTSKADNHVSWQQSEEGRSRMAQLTKATVAVESPATKMSRKYLKLFAPSNSAHDTYKVLATVHRRMNGTGWPRRGGWDSYLVRRSRMELDEGRVYGIRSKEGRVELLVLSSNNVCGRIPPTIARLESLKCINLSDNHMSGPIPVELGSLLQLQTLQLQGNNLRDTIPPLLGSLISLIRLSLGHNKLSGSLPDSLGNLVHLQYFSAEHNRLSGPVPSFMCHMTALQTFNVSNNELCGAIPDQIGALTRLRKLDFANNKFSGDIPAGLGNLLSLNWLLLDHNQLTGPVPASLGNLKELLLLNLSFNRLSGPLPVGLVLLIKLTTVSLQGNLFVGPFQFPATDQFWYSRTSGMAALDFGSNDIEEPFPDMRGMRQLQVLSLNNNRIYDQLAESLAEACPNLFKLHLQNNRLSGKIPHNLGALTKLEVLDLSNNCFDGSLPPSMESLQLLNSFSASNNELSGELPSFLGSLTLLTSLALNGNQFGGSMPRELGKLTLLKRLYLEKNELVGSIPEELSKCTSLEELYLHDNRLWGKIPDSLRALRGLRYLYLYRLQDLYLNDNNLDGSIPERMVVNCECLQRLYLGGNRLTGTVPRYLRHVRDLRELNIERNNLHGELPIPLFLKASLGRNACGLKWAGNPRIIDSRHNFTSVLAGAQRADPEKETMSAGPPDLPPPNPDRHSISAYKPIAFTLQVPNRRTSHRPRPSMSLGLRKMPTGLCLDPERTMGDEGPKHSEDGDDNSEELGTTGGIGGVEEGHGELGDDSGNLARPWANGEDVSYFLFKVIAGNALVLIDFVIAVRLYAIGCVWGCVLVMLWKAMAGFEGVLVTRRLGYGCLWLPMSALGLALTWQARICFRHSCESDLFQALQEVEWRWHAMIQLATQLAAALSWWGRGQVGHWFLLASVGLKALVVGIVSMQRLDDKWLTRYREDRRSGSPRLGTAPSIFRDRFLPWLRDSAWPRLILVGFHVAEVCERTVPLASFTAALGDWAFFAPFALTPGMFARYVARRARPSRSRSGSGGVASSVRLALKLSLALDSSFGAGTRGHVLATTSTTVEAILFEAIASKTPRDYPDGLRHGLMYSIFAMLVFTWAVVVLELAIPVGRGHDREREPGRLIPPPPSPRLLMLGRFAPSKPFSRPGSRSRRTPTTIHVQPSTSSLAIPDTDSVGSSESERIEDGRRKLGGQGGGAAVVVPIEG
eukprot:g20303.t2